MRFHFRLRETQSMPLWRDADGAAHLHWFGLTDGWYWIEAEGSELFRYSQVLVDKWRSEHQSAPWLEALPYVDYQVARLWEDVLNILPDVLEPVPKALAQHLGSGGAWHEWMRVAWTTPELQTLDSMERVYDATNWWITRRVDTAYLQAGPNIWFWSDGESLHLEWDNHECTLDGQPAWEAAVGEDITPTEEFLAEVRNFDMRLIRRMHDRVTLVQGGEARPGITLDPGLSEDQRQRAQRLSTVLAHTTPREPTDWESVIRAVEAIQAQPIFPAKQRLPLR